MGLPRASEILLRAREKSGASLEKASQDLKIQVKFLKALEAGNFKVFSSSYQLNGFLKNYANYLGLSAAEVLAFFRRDFREDFSGEPKLHPAAAAEPWLQPERVAWALGLVLLIIFAVYLFRQYQSFSRDPLLILESPASDLKVKSLQIEVKGRTCTDCQVSLNGQFLNVSTSGEFATSVSLRDGINELTVTAISRAGRETKIVRRVLVEP